MDGSSLSASDVAMLAGNNDGFGNNGLWLFAILALMGGGFGGWGYGNRDFGYQPQRAIDNAKFEAAQNTALINANISEKTQKILDTLTGNQMAMMRDQIQSLQMQNMLSGVVRYPTSSAYSAGNSPFCNCGNYGCCCGN